ncbi:MAG: riboflavin synthase [Bacteroidota bacterium]|nr:riboflavin synthase [Bacteroidota bacterium]
MFTGIIEETGVIRSVSWGAKSAVLIVSAEKVLEDIHAGDSINTNGSCLTVTTFGRNHFRVDVMAETMRKTNLQLLKPGSEVNLERAMKADGRFGGHMVSGHIDGTGIISEFEKEDNATWISVQAPVEILRYIVYKGSVAIDGVSLTVAYVDEKSFKVSIIPHTSRATTLLKKNKGDAVNIECDMTAKYIEKFLKNEKQQQDGRSIDMDFLSEHGYTN